MRLEHMTLMRDATVAEGTWIMSPNEISKRLAISHDRMVCGSLPAGLLMAPSVRMLSMHPSTLSPERSREIGIPVLRAGLGVYHPDVSVDVVHSHREVRDNGSANRSRTPPDILA